MYTGILGNLAILQWWRLKCAHAQISKARKLYMAAGGQGFPRGVFATVIANQAHIRPPETASGSKELIVVKISEILVYGVLLLG